MREDRAATAAFPAADSDGYRPPETLAVLLPLSGSLSAGVRGRARWFPCGLLRRDAAPAHGQVLRHARHRRRRASRGVTGPGRRRADDHRAADARRSERGRRRRRWQPADHRAQSRRQDAAARHDLLRAAARRGRRGSGQSLARSRPEVGAGVRQQLGQRAARDCRGATSLARRWRRPRCRDHRRRRNAGPDRAPGRIAGRAGAAAGRVARPRRRTGAGDRRAAEDPRRWPGCRAWRPR